jgi:hypothetical protein
MVFGQEWENIKKLFKDNDSNTSKLYIFIDELDRCRPTYAIEFLERIKHLLDIDGLVFILAMDKVQLSHSVKGVYGNEFEAIGYLRRFIDIEYFLPESNLNGFIDHLYQIFGFDDFFERRKEYRAFQYDVQHLNGVFKLLASSKKMSLREIEQLFAKINLVLHATGENTHLYPALLAFLIIVKEFHIEVYRDYVQESSTPDHIIALLYEIVPENIRLESFECALIEAFLISAKNRDHSSNIGQSLEKHNKNITDESCKEKQQSYSDEVIRISKRPLDSLSSGISLKSLVARIDMLENFRFGGEDN